LLVKIITIVLCGDGCSLMKWLSLPLLLLLFFVLTACRQSAQSTPTPEATVPDDIVMTLEVEPAPPAVGDAVLVITVRRAAGEAVDDAAIAVRGDMNHAGMTPAFGEVEGGSDGVYRVPFEWTMGGDWIITVDVTLTNGEIVSRTFDLSVDS
jgi:hypothetical protein